jgi:hypothetical protein
MPDGQLVSLVAMGSYGAQLFQTTFIRRMASFVIPPENSQQAGVVTLFVKSGAAQGHGQLTILAGPAAEPIVPLVGPRSIPADGETATMVAVVPYDEFGNPLPDETAVQIRALHPDNQMTEIDLVVQNLTAWTWLPSSTTAGRTPISGHVGQAHGPEVVLLEVAGWPQSFGVTAVPGTMAADGYELLTLRTDVVRDEFGNVLPDGTAVTFIVNDENGTERTIPAFLLDGVAETTMQAAVTPGLYQARAVLYGVASQPAQIEFTPGPAVGHVPITITKDGAAGALWLAAGPLLGEMEQYVPDGTRVRFVVRGPDDAEQVVTAVSDAGHAQAELRLAELAAGSYSVLVQVGAGSGEAAFSIP